jgi:hypothetical protein
MMRKFLFAFLCFSLGAAGIESALSQEVLSPLNGAQTVIKEVAVYSDLEKQVQYSLSSNVWNSHLAPDFRVWSTPDAAWIDGNEFIEYHPTFNAIQIQDVDVQFIQSLALVRFRVSQIDPDTGQRVFQSIFDIWNHSSKKLLMRYITN